MEKLPSISRNSRTFSLRALVPAMSDDTTHDEPTETILGDPWREADMIWAFGVGMSLGVCLVLIVGPWIF